MYTRSHFLAVVVTIAIAVSSPASAEDYDQGHPDKHHGVNVAANEGHDHAKEHGHDDKAHFEGKTFASVKEAWSFVTEKVAEAEKLVADKKLEPVHEISEQLGNAVHTLEEKSDMVTGQAKAKLAAALKQLDKAADDLHHSAEGNDADGTMLNLKKVKGLLPLIQSLYPAGAL
jgi:hypothetical protein